MGVGVGGDTTVQIILCSVQVQAHHAEDETAFTLFTRYRLNIPRSVDPNKHSIVIVQGSPERGLFDRYRVNAAGSRSRPSHQDK